MEGISATGPWKFLYQGKEYVTDFGYNNYDFHSRSYDPYSGRFNQIDGANQFASGYTGMGNNPVSMVDPDGQFAGMIAAAVVLVGVPALAGIVRGITNEARGESNFFKGFGQGFGNQYKIYGGLFATDPNKEPWQNAGAILSRLTWESLQTASGLVYNTGHNLTGQVDWVKYKYGATVVSSTLQPGGITLGSYITGGARNTNTVNDIQADENNSLFQHEYGHTIQSRMNGPFYFANVGIPSIISTGQKYSFGSHDFSPPEQEANALGFKYFNKHIAGFTEASAQRIDGGENTGWNFFNNPLDVNKIGRQSRFDFLDYSDINQRNSLRNLSLNPSPFTGLGGPLLGGFINHWRYKRRF
jgi:RHS repeat-associated protein